MGGSELGLLGAFVPQVLDGILAGVQAALSVQGPVPREVAVLQWAACGALNGTSLHAVPEYAALDPHYPEFRAWATEVQGVPAAAAALPADAAAAFLALLAADNPGAPANVGFLLQAPLAAVEAAVGCAGPTCQLLQGYLGYVMSAYATGALQQLLGEPLQPESGGLFVAKTMGQWIDGWQDPLMLALMGEELATQSLVPGLARGGAAEQRLKAGEPVASPFVNEVHVRTGVDDLGAIGHILALNGGTARPYSTFNWTYTGSILEDFSTGSRFGMDFSVKPDLDIWSLGLQRNIKWNYKSFQYENPLQEAREGMLTYVYEPEEAFFGGCGPETAADAPQCRLHDLQGALNLTEAYQMPLLITQPYMANADPHLPHSFGNATVQAPKWHVELLPEVGAVLRAEIQQQYNVRVAPTEVTQPQLWNGQPFQGGLWYPLYWTTMPVQLSDKDVHKIKRAMLLVRIMLLTFRVAVPILSALALIYTVYKLFYNSSIQEYLGEKSKAIKSRSPSMVVPSGHDGRFNERRNSIIALSKEAAA